MPGCHGPVTILGSERFRYTRQFAQPRTEKLWLAFGVVNRTPGSATRSMSGIFDDTAPRVA